MILTWDEQQEIKPVAINDIERFEQIMQETEINDISKLLGVSLYQDVLNNPGNYTELLEGSSFEYCDKTINHKGLKYVIAYLNYSNYIEESQVFDTYTGLVRKKREDSESVGQGTINNLKQKNREIAMYQFSFVDLYMRSAGIKKTQTKKLKFTSIKTI